MNHCTCEIPKYPHTEFYSPRNPHQSIQRLCKLLEDKMSQNMIERHVIHMKEVTQDNQYGFFICDLEYVIRIIEIVCHRYNLISEYSEPFKNFLKICAKPPLCHNLEEEIAGINHLQEYISVIGFLIIWLCDPEIHCIIFKVLYELLLYKEKTSPYSVAIKTLQNAICNSHLPEIIVQLIEISPVHCNYQTVLDICLLLSRLSTDVCRRMVALEAIDYLALRIAFIERKDCLAYLNAVVDLSLWIENIDRTDQTFMIYWNFYHAIKDAPKEYLDSVKGPSRNALWALRISVRVDIMLKYRNKQRNNKTALLLGLLTVLPNAEVIASGFAEVAVFISGYPELPFPPKCWANMANFQFDELYLEYKKLFLSFLMLYPKHPAMKTIFVKYKVVLSLCKLVSLDNADIWPRKEDAESLAKYALKVLYVLMPDFIDFFIGYSGPLRLLVQIETFMIENYDKEFLKSYLKVLNKAATLRSPKFIKNIHDFSEEFILMKLCTSILSQQNIKIIDHQILAYCFSILSCTFQKENSICKDVVCLLIQYMQRCIEPCPRDMFLYPYTLIAAIDYLWEAVVHCKKCLTCFIKNGGVYALLDIIEISCFPVQTIGLGCLVDITENVGAVPFLLTWRGGPKKTLVLYSLLAEIFAKENKQLKTFVSDSNVIKDPKAPLMGKNQYKVTYSNKKPLSSSPTVADMYGSCRPKIFAIIQLLTNRHNHIVSEINRLYNIATIKLSFNERVTIVLAENYLLLKITEAWHELAEDVKNSKINLILVDNNMLTDITKKLIRMVEDIQESQESLLEKDNDVAINNENKHYNLLRESKFQDAFDALREINYIAKATDRKVMLKCKTIQTNQIEEMLKKGSILLSENCFNHKTYNANISTTAVFHQEYTIYQPTFCNDNCCSEA